MAGDLELEISRLVRQVPLPGLQLVLLKLQILALLPGNVPKAFELLEELWMGSSDSLYFVTLMLSVDDAFGTDWRTSAGEAVVAHELVRVVRARRTSTWKLGLTAVGRYRRSTGPHRVLILVEW
jgi:hypothetical protein